MGIDNRLNFIDEPGSDRRCPCRGREQGPRARDRGKGRGGVLLRNRRRRFRHRRKVSAVAATRDAVVVWLERRPCMKRERERERERESRESTRFNRSKRADKVPTTATLLLIRAIVKKKQQKTKHTRSTFFFLALHSSSMSSSSSSFQSFCQKCAYLYFFLNSSTISDFLFSFGFLFVCLFVCFLGVRVRWCPVNQYDAASGNRSRRGKKKIKEIRFPFAAWQPISGPGIWPTWLAMAKWKNLSSRPFNALRIPGWSRNLCVVV